jgi:ribosomal protein L12E/L44/L45/RPP1/RPP2
MGSGSVFSETLQTITTTKLEELAQQRLAFDEEHAALLAAAKAEKDPLKRLILLADGSKSCLGVKTSNSNNKGRDGRPDRVISGGTSNARLETDLENLDRFLEQAEFDPSVSPKVLDDWEKILRQYLSIQDSKFQYADLYGKLVTEWLSSEKATATEATGDVDMSESFEELPGAKKLASRAEWEKNVFEPATVDVEALKTYLERLFITNKKASTTAIKQLRNKVEQFESSLGGPAQFDVPTLRWVIQGLQTSDLLPNHKREVLKDFLSNNVILGEIGDVLSMRLRALDRWSWGDYVPLEQRRKLNGSYEIQMHEDVLQAIFLHYIGVKWSVFFKRAFRDIRRNNAWNSHRAEIPKTDLMRRDYFLGKHFTQRYATLDGKRDELHRNRYFVYRLLDWDTQEVEVEEGEEEAEYGDHVAASKKPMSAQKRQGQGANRFLKEQEEECEESDDEDMGYALFDSGPSDEPPPGPKKPMEAKQDLLHLVSTEIVVNTSLYGELSCFRTVFDSWNPLLPHQTALQVLEFFGVSEKWRAFFTKFLQVPLKFIDDSPSTEPRLRRRGTPESHTLSDMLGETVLFCLDFSVNQATGGALSHRLFDDVWFWNKDYETCAKAWACVTQFTETMGVKVSRCLIERDIYLLT